MVVFSCAVLAPGCHLSQGCSSAMDHVDSSTASSEYWFTLNSSCFTSTDHSGRNNHEGWALQFLFAREASVSCYPEECCYSVRSALPYVPDVFTFRTSGLTSIENVPKAARTFAEALLRTWRPLWWWIWRATLNLYGCYPPWGHSSLHWWPMIPPLPWKSAKFTGQPTWRCCVMIRLFWRHSTSWR